MALDPRIVREIRRRTGPQGGEGLQGIQGSQGSTGLQGIKGDKGDIGSTGATGIQGPIGPSKRIDTYSGTTDSNGDLVITFSSAFSTTPVIIPVLYPTNTAQQIIRLTAVSTTGCTVKVEERSEVVVLAVHLPTFAVTNVNGASVKVFVIEV